MKYPQDSRRAGCDSGRKMRVGGRPNYSGIGQYRRYHDSPPFSASPGSNAMSLAWTRARSPKS